MEFKEICNRLGYPTHSDAVYRALLESKEPLLVSAIAERARVSRMVVYRCLKALTKDGLAQTSRFGKRVYYTAESPRKLHEIFTLVGRNTEKTIEKYATKREKDVPRSVRFFYGASGIRRAFDDVIEHTKRGDTFFRYTSEQDLEKVNRYLSRNYRDRRDKKKLERLVISNPASGKQKRSRLERFIKFVPADVDQFDQNVIQLVYGDRIALIDLNAEQVMIIENRQLAEFQKVIFKLLYNKL